MSEEEIPRFTTWQVIQHALWALAFTTLLVTGLALKFPNNFLSSAVLGIGMGARANLHRLAGLLFWAVGLTHIVYYLAIDRGKKSIILNLQDIKDLVQDFKYHLRMTDEEPKFGRYTWVEKFDYWAGAAGSFIIGITGLALWQSYGGPAGFGGLNILSSLPLQIYNWFRMIHGWEAILAGSVIVMLHTYMAIWRPGTFPLAKQIWTGKMPKHHYEHEHPLELEEMGK